MLSGKDTRVSELEASVLRLEAAREAQLTQNSDLEAQLSATNDALRDSMIHRGDVDAEGSLRAIQVLGLVLNPDSLSF